MARNFNGTSDYISVDTTVGGSLTTFTASMMIRLSANQTTEKPYLERQDTLYKGPIFLYGPNFSARQNTIGCYLSFDNGGSSCSASSATNTLTLNTWYVIVSTWVGVGNAPKLYSCTVGGTLTECAYASTTSTGTTQDTPTATLRIGTRDPLDSFAAGDICEVGLWNRVLPSTELAQLGQGYAPICFPQGLQLYAQLSGANTPEVLRTSTNTAQNAVMTGTTRVAGPDGIKYPRMPSPNARVRPRPFAPGLAR